MCVCQKCTIMLTLVISGWGNYFLITKRDNYYLYTFFLCSVLFISLWFLNTKDMRSINKRNEGFLGNNKLGGGRVRIPTYSHLCGQVKRLVFSSHPGFALR